MTQSDVTAKHEPKPLMSYQASAVCFDSCVVQALLLVVVNGVVGTPGKRGVLPKPEVHTQRERRNRERIMVYVSS